MPNSLWISNTPPYLMIRRLMKMRFLTCSSTDRRSAKSSSSSGSTSRPAPLSNMLSATNVRSLPSSTVSFLGSDFIAVTKIDSLEWFSLKPAILAAIMEHYASGLPVVEILDQKASSENETDSETVQQIKHLIDTRVRPAVAMDGGDITFSSYEDGIVTLQMRGACQGCPSSAATLKMGIENMLRHYIPEVKEVRPAAS